MLKIHMIKLKLIFFFEEDAEIIAREDVLMSSEYRGGSNLKLIDTFEGEDSCCWSFVYEFKNSVDEVVKILVDIEKGNVVNKRVY